MKPSSGRLTLLAAVTRAMRARASLTIGSLLLAAVAIASAVLGPTYQSASSQSFLVARLQEATPISSGVSFTWRPEGELIGNVDDALDAAPDIAAADLEKHFDPPSLTVESDRVPVRQIFDTTYDGVAHLAAKEGICDHVEVEGSCPTGPGEAMMLRADADLVGAKIGDQLRFPGLDDGLRLVGIYTVPDSATGFLFDPSRFATVPPLVGPLISTPYQQAPLVVDTAVFEDVLAGSWKIAVDRALRTPPDITPDDVVAARKAVVALPRELKQRDDGDFVVSDDNILQFAIADIETNRDTARNTVLPAVVSLVLVALALLVRLLGAAADQRRAELALGSLRGMSSRQMWTFGLAEPLAVVAVATPIGFVVGYGSCVALARLWLTADVPVTLPLASVVGGLLVLLAAVVASILTVGRAVNETLASQLAGVRRPRRSTRPVLVAKMVVFAAAVVVVATSATAKGRSDPDSGDLVLPLLLATAAGVVTTAITVAIARWWSHRTSARRGITGFVAARAVSRRRDASLVVLPLTAALAIAVFAAGVYAAASSWRESTAATEVGADVSYVSPVSLGETVTMTHQLDPDGQWLMAAGTVTVANRTEKLLLDTPRLARVGAWPGTWTPGLDAADVADLLGPHSAPLTLTGTELAITLDNEVEGGGSGLGLSMQVIADDGQDRRLFLGPYPAGSSTQSVDASFCADGCMVQSLLIGGPAATSLAMTGQLTITDLAIDGMTVPGGVDRAAWRPLVTESPDEPEITQVEPDGSALTVTIDTAGKSTLAGITPDDVPAARPILVGRTAELDVLARTGDVDVIETGQLQGLAVRPVATTDSMPFLGPRGLVVDYTMYSRDQEIPVDESAAWVLARSDTPRAVLDQLHGRGVTHQTELDEVKSVLDQDAYALALNLYLVAAIAAVVLALAGLAVTLAVQLPERRRDAASLRVIGVRRRQIVRAVFVEIAAVLGLAGLAGVAAGSLAQYLVVRTVTLGFADELRTPRVVPTLDAQRLSLLAAVVVLVLVGVATFVAALAVRRARASTLRESGR